MTNAFPDAYTERVGKVALFCLCRLANVTLHPLCWAEGCRQAHKDVETWLVSVGTAGEQVALRTLPKTPALQGAG